MRLERAETDASTETGETRVTTDNTAAGTPRTCGTPETAPAGSRWNTGTETGTESGTERGTGIGTGMTLTGKTTHQCRKREVTEEDMAEKRDGARAGQRVGTNHAQRGREEEGDVHRTTLRKVRKWFCVLDLVVSNICMLIICFPPAQDQLVGLVRLHRRQTAGGMMDGSLVAVD